MARERPPSDYDRDEGQGVEEAGKDKPRQPPVAIMQFDGGLSAEAAESCSKHHGWEWIYDYGIPEEKFGQGEGKSRPS